MAYLSRNNDNPSPPWSVPVTFGMSLGQIDAAGLIQSNFGTPGNLELIARVGNKLSHFWYSFTTKQWTGLTVTFSEPTCNPVTQGEWRVAHSLGPLPNKNGVIGIHAALLHTNKVLFFGFQEGNDGVCTASVLDLANGVQTQVNPNKNKFCSGHAFLSDGRLVVASGHASLANAKSLHTFTPNATAGTWQDIGNMKGGSSNGGRWYPNCTKLPNGNVIILGGTDGEGRVIDAGTCKVDAGKKVNASYEIFDGTNLKPPVSVSIFNDYINNAGPYGLYPFVFVLPNGKLFVHARNLTYILNPTTGTFDSSIGLPTKAKTARHYPSAGTCLLLPLLPTNNYKARVMIIGGGTSCIKNANGTFTRIDDQGNPVTSNVQNSPATKTCEIIDLSVAQPAWQLTPPMSQPRVMPDSVLLPDGKVLVVGGSRTGGADNAINPVLEVELYDPGANTWTVLCKMHVPRLYHSSAFLLPTGEVMTAGKDDKFNPSPFNYPEYRLEIFKPPYLFKGARPTMTNAPTAIAYNSTFNIQTPDGASIASAVLMAPAAVTHSFNMQQRYVGLTFSTTSGGLSLQAPPNANIAPPGYYMLFIVNSNGVPSVAKFVRLD
ncbi:MAG: DUF1929 domain-containing protein [Hydrococcus sp. RM1_1_31]|nr:DUF1929 domain-containing protein [Hydrococcus sp. RM1_1_31]